VASTSMGPKVSVSMRVFPVVMGASSAAAAIVCSD
jgi:hypothetical protein